NRPSLIMPDCARVVLRPLRFIVVFILLPLGRNGMVWRVEKCM
ncbi:MAG: hypothetical protein ACI9NG_002177, partial [Hyphomonas sp.]